MGGDTSKDQAQTTTIQQLVMMMTMMGVAALATR